MMKVEIPVRVYMDNLDEMLDELKQLQTYKLHEDTEKVLVDCDEVVKIFGKHLRTKVGMPEPQWIPVSERLPEVDEDVLVTDDAGGLATVNTDACGEYAEKSGKEFAGKRFWYASQNVTAWTPLPEPYKGGKNERSESGVPKAKRVCEDARSRADAKLRVAKVTWREGDTWDDVHDRCVDCLDDLPPVTPKSKAMGQYEG